MHRSRSQAFVAVGFINRYAWTVSFISIGMRRNALRDGEMTVPIAIFNANQNITVELNCVH